ncbi:MULTISPECIES: energy-coupling factor transporter transmembrane protein EcfT [unclassified Adlercreutzia]|uniref:energy-coupling factor transporter transmembrane component T family protein n=1 Tax=unclassified Adlercreutzia TaxID=2636013 RepID=UPI0013EC64D4|nr:MULTISPECIES: energy-coupling factor transporter transmembrane protein EcfT [unclassified Adlercreutzia]
MGRVFSFGSYFPGDSVVHRCDPRAKLVLACAFIVTVLLCADFLAVGACAAFVLVLYGVARLPVGKAAASLAPLSLIVVLAALLNLFVTQGGAVYVSLGFIQISEAGVRACLFVASRLVTMILAMSLVTMTTTTLDITEAFEHLLRPLARVGVPAHELAMILGIALRFLPQFAQELVTVYQAQVSRGARFAASPLAGGMRALTALVVPLFASAFRRAETLAGAMDARCYHGGEGRTRLVPLEFHARDAVAAASVAALAACVLAINFASRLT